MLKWLGGKRAEERAPAAPTPAPIAPAAHPDEIMRRAFPLHEGGDVAGAERLYRQILEIAPDYADAHYLLGRIEQDRGQLDLAIRHVREAVRHNSRDFSFQKTLGELHYNLGHYAEAVVYLDNAAALQPEDHEIWNNLGCACDKLGQTTQAAAHFKRALELSQNSPMALNNLAISLKDRGRADEAVDVMERLRHMRHDDPDLFSNYLYQLNFSTRFTAEQRYQEHLGFDALFGTGRFGAERRRIADADPARRLRIGYFSPDLRSHPVSCFIEGPLAHHDRRSFEVFCYYLHPYGDMVTDHLKTLADRWIECRGLNDDQIADRIAADRIDILIDLAGHTGGNRPAVLGRKPAPVIATWLGYPNTTGLRTVDYRITDAASDPEGVTDRYHTEKLARLPQQWCFAKPEIAADVTPSPAVRRGYVQFGSFNNSAKLTDAMVAAWASILEPLLGSRLLVWGVEDEQAGRIREIFGKRGIDAGRLEFSPRTSFPKQLLMYQVTDIALDTFPYSGVTTTFNSLWMGVPVVTLAGDCSAARSTHSILSGLGLDDWSASSLEQYAEIAVRKARDTVALATLRNRLREMLISSPFMDPAAFTRQLEQSYRSMWKTFCAAEFPKPSP